MHRVNARLCFVSTIALVTHGLGLMPGRALGQPPAEPVAPSPSATPPPAGSAAPSGEVVDLRPRFKIGTTLRYRFVMKTREGAADRKPIKSSSVSEALIEGTVKPYVKPSVADGTSSADAARKPAASAVTPASVLECKYARITVTQVIEGKERSVTPETKPADAWEKAAKRLLDQVMGKTIQIYLDTDGRALEVKGIPLEVFGGIAEYQPIVEEALKGGEDIMPTYQFLSSLGTASRLYWEGVMMGPAQVPGGKVSVGQTWRETEDGFGEEQLKIDELTESRAVIRRADKGEKLPSVGDPLRLPTRYVWDRTSGQLIRWESSFDASNSTTGPENVVCLTLDRLDAKRP